VKTLLILSQVYVPDPAAVGQHLADTAAEMVRRGWRVIVLTADRGYDDPSIVYPGHEVRDGVDIYRLPWSSFGKRSIPVRLAGGLSFITQATLRGLLTQGVDRILVSTSPPLCGAAALAIATLRGVPISYWVMDLNPDQMIELGMISERSVLARAFDTYNRLLLRRARRVVTLDRFMAERINRKRDVSAKLDVLPPWPPDDDPEPVAPATNPFRAAHGLHGKFVVMYSGNHSLSSPLTTLLQAALRVQDLADVVFLFVGGGVGKREVEAVIREHAPRNIRSLPYQPLAELNYSLSAADVHVVAVGNQAVGVVHPCKVYGAMAVGRPILLLGPQPCHVTDIIAAEDIGWRIAHGDVDGAERTLRAIAATERGRLDRMGAQARALAASSFSKRALVGRFCDVVEAAA
jgi:glycosyltransferase involved in cell wall biosynthesis